MINLRNLWHLQMLEEQQAKLKPKSSDPKVVSELKRLKTIIEQDQNKMKELKARHTKASQQIQQIAANIEELKTRLAEISDKIYDGTLQIKEIQTYQQRLDKLKKEVTASEDIQLEIMQQKEDIKREWEEQHKQLKEVTEEFKTIQQTYLAAKEEAKQLADKITKEIAALTQKIDDTLLNQYQELKKKHPQPIGRVTKETCSGCHLTVSYEKLKQLKSLDQPVKCNNCGRLLFWDPAN